MNREVVMNINIIGKIINNKFLFIYLAYFTSFFTYPAINVGTPYER